MDMFFLGKGISCVFDNNLEWRREKFMSIKRTDGVNVMN